MSRARAIAGIPAGMKLVGPAGWAALESAGHFKKCIAQARQAGDMARAAALSEAKAFLKAQLLRANRCECGRAISRGAVRCHICARPRHSALPAPKSEPKPKKLAKPPKKARHRLTHDWLPWCGYWSNGIQKLVTRWTAVIGENRCRSIVMECFCAVSRDGQTLALEVDQNPSCRSFAFAVLPELHRMLTDPKSVEGWLLKIGDVGENWDKVRNQPITRSYGRLIEIIVRRRGPQFTEDQLRKATKRLRLTD